MRAIRHAMTTQPTKKSERETKLTRFMPRMIPDGDNPKRRSDMTVTGRDEQFRLVMIDGLPRPTPPARSAEDDRGDHRGEHDAVDDRQERDDRPFVRAGAGALLQHRGTDTAPTTVQNTQPGRS